MVYQNLSLVANHYIRSEDVADNIKDLESKLWNQFGYKAFRDKQREIILWSLNGGSSVVLMPTGSGKSLCYQFIAAMSDEKDLVLVLSPLIALMQDQLREALAFGIDALVINSSLKKNERQAAYEKLKQGFGRLLFVTPERFRQTDFLEVIRGRRVTLLAVDEAHCMSQWGHDFRPDYSRVGSIRNTLNNPPVMALSATMTPQTEKDVIMQLKLSDGKESWQVFKEAIERPEFQLNVKEIVGDEAKLEEIENIRVRHKGASGIVYFSLIESIKKYSLLLSSRGIGHQCYHSQLSSGERRRVLTEFVASSNQVLLATPAFGLGINKPDIRYVVHAEVPGSLESYYQEVGRAGRDGASAEGLLLYDQDDLTIQMEFLKWGHPDFSYFRAAWALISSRWDEFALGGADFLRSQLHFYHSRDFRAEASLRIFERLGFLSLDDGEMRRSSERLQFRRPESEPSDADWSNLKKWCDPDVLKMQQKKLYELVQWIKNPDCRYQGLRAYFGFEVGVRCERCDRCRSRLE